MSVKLKVGAQHFACEKIVQLGDLYRSSRGCDKVLVITERQLTSPSQPYIVQHSSRLCHGRACIIHWGNF